MSIFGRKTTAETETPAAVSADLAALTGEYTIDTAHSTLGFTARHAMVTNVKGKFLDFSGSLSLDGSDPAKSSASIDVKMDSIDTGSADRDGHLKSADFFRTDEFPTMTFQSKRVPSAKDGTFQLVGDLTMHGVTKEVVLDVEGPTAEIKNPWGKSVMGASATTVLKRSEFGLTWNPALEAGGYVVGDEVKIQIDLELVKQ